MRNKAVAICVAAERLLEKRDGLTLHQRRLVAPMSVEAELRAAVAQLWSIHVPMMVRFDAAYKT